MCKNIEWQSDYSPADINVIRTVEKNVGIIFPDDYIEIALKYHGGKPSSNTIVINNKKIVFGNLLTFLAFDELDILDKYNSERNILLPKYFPFAIDENGNLFCFDYYNPTEPRIVFIEKKLDGSVIIQNIAENFHDFLYLVE